MTQQDAPVLVQNDGEGAKREARHVRWMPASRVECRWRHLKRRRAALDQADDEDALYAAAERTWPGQRAEEWATEDLGNDPRWAERGPAAARRPGR